MKWFGIALVVLALGIGIVPHYTDCLSQGKQLTLANGSMQPMKCHWSAQGEIAVAAPILAVGVMLTTTKRKGAATGLSVMGVVLGRWPSPYRRSSSARVACRCTSATRP